uniref:UBA domain containing 2 n=1 Tax=Neogobius melanostomus TaxID=47308 RepID=A0A8C6TVH1_9GOBI
MVQCVLGSSNSCPHDPATDKWKKMDGYYHITQNKAPLCKGLLLVLNGLTVMLTLLPQYQHMFEYNLQAISQHHQNRVPRHQRLFCSSLLIYNFRIFERRFGTRKFASFLLCTWFLSALMDFLLAQAFEFVFDYPVEELPFSSFCAFYNAIPRMPVTQIFGQIHITNKSLVYIVVLSCGFWLSISGALYHCNFLKIQKLVFVPTWVSRLGRCTLEPIFSSSQPVSETPIGMGATLDIQRQQRMDMLDQQLLFAQYNEARRIPRLQPQAGLLQWTRLFPSLRRRGQNHPTAQPQPQPQPQVKRPAVLRCYMVARLVEMGFSRIDALEALRASNNDINIATNFLLQH